jgi:rhodanese-related sulfurtransferase
MRIKRAIAQAAAVTLIGVAAAFVHNAFSINGIDPFRDLGDIPVVIREEAAAQGMEGEELGGICVVSMDEFRELIDAGRPILDARTPDEYRAGHIPGAILCDYFELGKYLDWCVQRIDPLQVVGIYCSGPACDDSEMLARELYALGYTKLCVFKGGIEKWTEAGLPLEYGTELEYRE